MFYMLHLSVADENRHGRIAVVDPLPQYMGSAGKSVFWEESLMLYNRATPTDMCVHF